MRILQIHNSYKIYGGEDSVVQTERTALEALGHVVEVYQRGNENIRHWKSAFCSGLLAAFNPFIYFEVRKRIKAFNPDIVHVHNYFPLISPSVFYACSAQKVPCVHTIHNYRPLCAAGTLFRAGNICTLCVDSNRINGIIHKCYRNSIIATISNTIVSISFKISIFQNRRFLSLILLTNFSKNIYIKSGYPNERIYTKGNFSTPASLAIEAFPRNGPITFVGRLSVEKGAQLLAEIASLTNHPIDVIGDGPEFEWLKRQAIQNLNLRGPITRNEALAAISRAKALIIPSLWYEGFPMVLVEAFSAGTPVIAPNIGSFRELIDDGETGILAEPKNASSWVNAIQRLEDTNTSRNISKNCLSDYNNQLSTARGVRQLINIYWACIHSVDNGGR